MKEEYICNECNSEFEISYDPHQQPLFCVFCGESFLLENFDDIEQEE